MQALSAMIDDDEEKDEGAVADDSEVEHPSGDKISNAEKDDLEPVTAELFSVARGSKRKREDGVEDSEAVEELEQEDVTPDAKES